MKVLFLGYEDSLLIDYLKLTEDVLVTNNKICAGLISLLPIDFIVSYGYRHLIDEEVLDLVPAINLHISYLPYNRGADPNFWSVANNTVKGVTIHKIDPDFDTGDILLQRMVLFTGEDTLRTSYNTLQKAIQRLFIDNWDVLGGQECGSWPQEKIKGEQTHRSKDKEKFVKALERKSGKNYLDVPFKEFGILYSP